MLIGVYVHHSLDPAHVIHVQGQACKSDPRKGALRAPFEGRSCHRTKVGDHTNSI